MTNLLATLAILFLHISPTGDTPEKHPADADTRVEIHNHSGSVTVIGWDKNEVEISRGAEGVDVKGTEHRIQINPRLLAHHSRELEVRVPSGSHVEIHGQSTEVKVSGVGGFVNVNVVSGDVRVEGPSQSVDVNSVGGDIEVVNSAKKTHAGSVSGNVVLKGLSGELDASSVSGELQVSAKVIDVGHLETVSGNLQFKGDLSTKGTLDVESVSGDVELAFGPSTGADFHASSFSGDIVNELGPEARTTGRWTHSKELTFSVGAGGARVSAKSLSGSISFRKLGSSK